MIGQTNYNTLVDFFTSTERTTNTDKKGWLERLEKWFVQLEIVQYVFSFFLWGSRYWILGVALWSYIVHHYMMNDIDLPQRKKVVCESIF